MVSRRPHPVQPGAAVLVPRRREAAPRQLLSIESKGGTLRRVAALGQRAGHCLALEMSAETRVVAKRIGHAPRVTQSGAHKQTGGGPRKEPAPLGTGGR